MCWGLIVLKTDRNVTWHYRNPQSGRYDPVETSLDKGSVGFQLVMVIFYFFTAILLLNVLIGRLDQYNQFAGGVGAMTANALSLSLSC
jgi:hypothetical protein